MSERKNVFISHVGEDSKGLEKLTNLISSKGLEFSDYSITKDNPNNAKDPDYIKKNIINPRLDRAGTLLVYLTKDMIKKDSEFVDHEIKRAANHENKRIIGVWAHGQADEYDLPDALDGVADAIVGWNGNSIIDAIEGRKDGYFKPDGTESSDRTIKHIRCQ